MSAEEIQATRGDGVFSQRVFAQGYPVGQQGNYDYWANHYRKPKPGSPDFWFPHSPISQYDVGKGLNASSSDAGRAATVRLAAPISGAMKLLKIALNAVPPEHWTIPINAPALPPFTPQALRFGLASDQFDQEKDPPGTQRQQDRLREAGDPYADASLGGTPQGDRNTEAALRYEDHARLRMKARRENRYPKGAKVGMEDDLSTATPEYRQWREQEIRQQLIATCDTHATDHSTIMTNPMHAERALAYDVAVGVSCIGEQAMRALRVIADWRLLKKLDDDHPHKMFFEYFRRGEFKNMSLLKWVQSHGSAGAMPSEIIDERTYQHQRDTN